MSSAVAELPVSVGEVTHTFLQSVDAAAPGLIEGLYLIGSVGLEDFQPHCSDIDFVAVSAAPFGKGALAALEGAHASVRTRYPRVAFEGTHLCSADLVVGPNGCASAPFSSGGRFEAAGAFAINPVTWHELVTSSVPIRGRTLGTGQVWQDERVLRQWTLENLRSYWSPWLARYRDSSADARFNDEFVAWGVLGVARLHYTLATGRITSKSGAGRHALDVFSARWTAIIIEALRIRQQPSTSTNYADVSKRHRDAAEFVRFAIDETFRIRQA